MAKYYYLISSLPMLSLENEPAISYQDFLARCREQLSDSDFKELEKAVFSKTDGARHPLMRRWEHYINDVNSILKDERSRKLGWETEGFSNVDNPALRDRIHRASFSMNTNPEVSFPFSPQASTSMKKGVPASKSFTVKRYVVIAGLVSSVDDCAVSTSNSSRL